MQFGLSFSVIEPGHQAGLRAVSPDGRINCIDTSTYNNASTSWLSMRFGAVFPVPGGFGGRGVDLAVCSHRDHRYVSSNSHRLFRVGSRGLSNAEKLATTIRDGGFPGEIGSYGRTGPAFPHGWLPGRWQLPSWCPGGTAHLSTTLATTDRLTCSFWPLGLALISLESPPSRVSKG